MRTTDFSRAPAIGQATAQFVGGTRFTGVRSLVELYQRWRPMVQRLKRAALEVSGAAGNIVALARPA